MKDFTVTGNNQHVEFDVDFSIWIRFLILIGFYRVHVKYICVGPGGTKIDLGIGAKKPKSNSYQKIQSLLSRSTRP